MPLKAVGIAPKFDNATNYSYEWYKGEHSFLDDNVGKWVLEDSLEKLEAVEKIAHKSIELHDPDLVVFYDHGNLDYWVGNDGRTLMTESGLYLLKGRSVFTMCCLAAKVLGVKAVRAGAKEYWGYTENYAFTYDSVSEHGDVSGYGLRQAHKGYRNLFDVLEDARQHFYDVADRLRGDGKTIAAAVMVRDADALVCWNKNNLPVTPKSWLERLIEWIKKLLGIA